jgi:hypothetical protein
MRGSDGPGGVGSCGSSPGSNFLFLSEGSEGLSLLELAFDSIQWRM